MRNRAMGSIDDSDSAAVLTIPRRRRPMNLPEMMIWRFLRSQPDGLKFRHHHVSSPFVFTFYCNAARLGVVIAGQDAAALPPPETTALARLREAGIMMLTIPAEEAMRDAVGATRSIIALARSRVLPNHPAFALGRRRAS